MTKSDGVSLAGAFQRQRDLEHEEGEGVPVQKQARSPLRRVDLQPLEGKVYLDMVKQYQEKRRPLSPVEAKQIVQKYSNTKNHSSTLNRMAKIGAITQDETRKSHVSRIPIQDIAVYVEGRQILPEPSFARVSKKAAASAGRPPAAPSGVADVPVLNPHMACFYRKLLELQPASSAATRVFATGELVAIHNGLRLPGRPYDAIRHLSLVGLLQVVEERNRRQGHLRTVVKAAYQELGAPEIGVQPEAPAPAPAEAATVPAIAAVPEAVPQADAADVAERHTPTGHERAAMVPPEPAGSMEDRIHARLAQLDEHDREIDAQVASLTAQRDRNAATRQELERLLQAERDLKERASALGVV